MSLFPDIWWQSPPHGDDDSDKDNGGVRSRYPHRPFFIGNDRRRHDHEKNNGMKSSTTTTDPNRNGTTRKYRNNNDFDVGIRSCSYGSMHDDDNDDEGVAIRDDGETLLPVVYSPTLVDNDNSNNNNDNVQSDISSEDSCYNGVDDHDHDDDDDSIEIIEQPHRSMGLIFFDFIRCIAVSANVRCLNTQLMPIIMSLGGGVGVAGGDTKHHHLPNSNNNSNPLDMLSVALR